MRSDYSHSMAGVILFDLPMGILLAFIFHNLVKESLFDNLPQIIRQRVVTFKRFNWSHAFKNNWPVVLISIVIGALSHILWDSFTHEYGYFVVRISELQNKVELYNLQIPVYRIVQHTSTLVGGLILAIAFFKMPANEKVNSQISLRYWVIFTSICLSVILLQIVVTQVISYRQLIVTSISAGLIALIVTPILKNYMNRVSAKVKSLSAS